LDFNLEETPRLQVGCFFIKKDTELLCFIVSQKAKDNVSSSAEMHFQDSMQKLWPTFLKNR
jgi:hypothetical protein